MNTKLLMTISAFIMGVTGIILSFLPREVGTYLSLASTNPIVLQLMGSLYFGFAMINWMSKENLIGGIYGRPVAIGNFTHFLIGGLALVKLTFNNSGMAYIPIAAMVYSVFAILFGYVFFANPATKNNSV